MDSSIIMNDVVVFFFVQIIIIFFVGRSPNFIFGFGIFRCLQYWVRARVSQSFCFCFRYVRIFSQSVRHATRSWKWRARANAIFETMVRRIKGTRTTTGRTIDTDKKSVYSSSEHLACCCSMRVYVELFARYSCITCSFTHAQTRT